MKYGFLLPRSRDLSEDLVHSNFIQLGRVHLSFFGISAAIGLVSGLALSQRTARYSRLDATALWNAGMTAVVSAFIISRVLLIEFNWHSFLTYPMLVMALPSLTWTGVLLTCFLMTGYLRWRGIRLLAFLDAMAPCVALLWVFLSAGRFAEGTRDGMATQLAWGVSDGTAVRVHAVELYTLAAASVICLLLMRELKARRDVGETAGIGLVLAGLAIYFIDFFRLPSNLVEDAWLDPAQAVAIAVFVAGCALFLRGESRIQTATGDEGHDAVEEHAAQGATPPVGPQGVSRDPRG